MSNPIYHRWTDVVQWLDPKVYKKPDPARLQAIGSQTEMLFEAEMRGRITVPIVEEDSPDTFAQARIVCAMRTAATFSMEQNQAEGRDEMAWYPKWLEGKALDMIEKMASPHLGPEDRVAAEAPLAYIPTDGRTADTRSAATFTRDQIASGTGTHF